MEKEPSPLESSSSKEKEDEEAKRSGGNSSDDDEFFDALEDQQDVDLLQKNLPQESVAAPTPVLRRRASFHVITEVEERGSDSEDEENAAKKKKDEIQKLRDKMKMHNALKPTATQPGASDNKSYFKEGSVRNGPFDEDFFRVFEQVLDQAISKMKEQQGDADNDGSDNDDGCAGDNDDYGQQYAAGEADY